MDSSSPPDFAGPSLNFVLLLLNINFFVIIVIFCARNRYINTTVVYMLIWTAVATAKSVLEGSQLCISVVIFNHLIINVCGHTYWFLQWGWHFNPFKHLPFNSLPLWEKKAMLQIMTWSFCMATSFFELGMSFILSESEFAKADNVFNVSFVIIFSLQNVLSKLIDVYDEMNKPEYVRKKEREFDELVRKFMSSCGGVYDRLRNEQMRAKFYTALLQLCHKNH